MCRPVFGDWMKDLNSLDRGQTRQRVAKVESKMKYPSPSYHHHPSLPKDSRMVSTIEIKIHFSVGDLPITLLILSPSR